MAVDDPLDNQVALEIQITKSGLTGKAKSRAVSGFDRLIGNITEFFNVKIEAVTAPQRSQIERQKRLSAATTDDEIAQITQNTELTQRALAIEIASINRRQENKDKVVEAASEQLRLMPPTLDQTESGDDQLSPEFLSRLERYAEDASTANLRDRWGQVLAAEVRKPGTFSARIMRIVDEIDPDTARKFTELAQHRIGSDVPKCLYSIGFDQAAIMAEYDLIKSNDVGVIRLSRRLILSNGDDCYFITLGNFAVTLQADGAKERIQTHGDSDLLQWEQDVPAMPIISPTKSGEIIMSLLDECSFSNCSRVLEKIRLMDPSAKMLQSNGISYQQVS